LPTSSSSDTRLRLGLRDDDIVVLLVAALRPEKRVDVFLEAVTTAHAQDARVRGIVAGGGPALSGLRTQAQALGGAVRLIGERADVSALMASADAVCLTSDVEAVPVTLLEAMAAARPVIATSVGGVSELVTPSETGWLVPPRDPSSFAAAILELASDPKRGRALGKNGRARFEREYTVDLMVQRYAELLSEDVQDSQKD
jgi:glycosyltransferase involved in cell wall biosynthesis